jgi:predicted nuclease of restriction endonuclease-like (RecB) superfamily
MTGKHEAPSPNARDELREYAAVRDDIIGLLESAHEAAVRTVNALMTATYWAIGRRIVEAEQRGKRRASYGERLIERLATDLLRRFKRGFSRQNLQQMRAFYLAWPSEMIRQTPSGESLSRVAPPLTAAVVTDLHLRDIARRFPLPWSAYVRLLSVKDPDARAFYESEALHTGWSVRQLDRQITTQFYERAALSKNKAAMLKKARATRLEDEIAPEEAIKDPYVLEFLSLKDEYSESDLEAALVHRLEDFLLELGDDFAFLGRQRRLRVDDEWYRIDLLFFHRRLKALIVIDLKVGKFTHADAGQMHLYLNYAREHWMRPGENPPVGLILCAQKGTAVARYALEGLSNKVLASEYRMVLPDAERIAEELRKAQRALETHEARIA